MTAHEIAEVVEDLLRSLAEDQDGDPTELRGATLCSFARADLLTSDAGVVVTLTNGAEYQVSAIKSRAGHIEDKEDTEEDDYGT